MSNGAAEITEAKVSPMAPTEATKPQTKPPRAKEPLPKNLAATRLEEELNAGINPEEVMRSFIEEVEAKDNGNEGDNVKQEKKHEKDQKAKGEKPTEKEFISKVNKILYELLDTNIINNTPSSDPEWGYRLEYTVEIDQAIKLLERYKANEPKPTKEDQTFSETTEILRKEASEALTRVIDVFVEKGFLSEELQRQIRRLIKPSNIEIVTTDYHRFLYLKNTFPEEPEDEGVIQVGVELINLMERDLGRIFSEMGIGLSPEQIRKIALIQGLSHEFGHIVDRVLRLMEIEKRITSAGESLSETAIRVDREIDDFLRREFPDEELEEILKNEPENGTFTYPGNCYSEKIATGFELIGLTEALLSEGVSASDVDKIMEALYTEKSRRLEEYKRLISFSRQKGFNLETLGEAINHLTYYLKNQGKTDLRDMLPLSFGIRTIGYYRPLNPDQIRKFILSNC